jgi:hypothetical protein
MKRIVEETLADGTKQYRVEKNTKFFGLIKCNWHTDTFYIGGSWDTELPAVFNSLELAESHAYGKPKSKEVIRRKIL